MSHTQGTQGYEKDTVSFIEASQNMDFFDVCKVFVPFLPKHKATALDVGAGAGQNVAALAGLGHQVTAIEPMSEFLTAAKTKYANLDMQWLQGHLPELDCLPSSAKFDFILVEGVMHHLTAEQQIQAIQRLSKLLNPGGKLAISLRNGPAGMGTCVYPTNAESLLETAESTGLKCVFDSGVKPSIYKHKVGVTFQRLVFSH